MNQQQHNASLANVEFNPDTVRFDGFALSGLLEADDAVRETYFTNTIADATKADEAFVQSQSLPVGVVLLNPAEYAPSELGMEGQWGTELIRTTDATAEHEELTFSLVSLDDEEAAGALQVKVQLCHQVDARETNITFHLGSMLLKEGFEGRGHKLDMAAAACWLAQDIATCLYLEAPSDVRVAVRVETLESSQEAESLAVALATTLDGVREAVKLDVENAQERFAPVELNPMVLEAA
jgi:hypothetical protein